MQERTSTSKLRHYVIGDKCYFIYRVAKHSCLWTIYTLISQQDNKPVQLLLLLELFNLPHRKLSIMAVGTNVKIFSILGKVEDLLYCFLSYWVCCPCKGTKWSTLK